MVMKVRKLLARSFQDLCGILVRSWKDHGEILERSWQDLGRQEMYLHSAELNCKWQ